MKMILNDSILCITQGKLFIAQACDILPLIRKCLPKLLLLETGVDAVGKFTLESEAAVMTHSSDILVCSLLFATFILFKIRSQVHEILGNGIVIGKLLQIFSSFQ